MTASTRGPAPITATAATAGTAHRALRERMIDREVMSAIMTRRRCESAENLCRHSAVGATVSLPAMSG